jgi:hypothetical protein
MAKATSQEVIAVASTIKNSKNHSINQLHIGS